MQVFVCVWDNVHTRVFYLSTGRSGSTDGCSSENTWRPANGLKAPVSVELLVVDSRPETGKYGVSLEYLTVLESEEVLKKW